MYNIFDFKVSQCSDLDSMALLKNQFDKALSGDAFKRSSVVLGRVNLFHYDVWYGGNEF